MKVSCLKLSEWPSENESCLNWSESYNYCLVLLIEDSRIIQTDSDRFRNIWKSFFF